MLLLVYDGTMAGLLTAVFESYERRAVADTSIVKEEHFQPDAFAQPIHIHTDLIKARRVWKGLSKKISAAALDQLYYCFLSEQPGIENIILSYISYAFTHPGPIEQDFGNAAVLTITQLARKVWREKHRMEAFVRFSEIQGNLYYALIEPDHNVLPLIAPHFSSRYADQDWLIYDGLRKYGLLHNKEDNTVREVQPQWNEQSTAGTPDKQLYAPTEALYQQLWKDYFKSTGIPSRVNPTLHLKHIPYRYWKHLTEKHQ